MLDKEAKLALEQFSKSWRSSDEPASLSDLYYWLDNQKAWRDMVVDFKDRNALFISNGSDKRHTVTREMMMGTIEHVTPIEKQEKTAIIEGVEYDTFGVLHFRVDIGDYYIPVRSNEEVGLLCTPVNRNEAGYSQTFFDKFFGCTDWEGE